MATDTSAATFERLLRGFLGRASAAMEAEMGAAFDPRVLDSIDLAHHNEGLIGLENLCSNLDEYGIRVSEEERRSLLEFGDAWGLRERDVHVVGALPSA